MEREGLETDEVVGVGGDEGQVAGCGVEEGEVVDEDFYVTCRFLRVRGCEDATGYA